MGLWFYTFCISYFLWIFCLWIVMLWNKSRYFLCQNVAWHHVIKTVTDNNYYLPYTILFSDTSCVLLKQMCWFWHDFTWNLLYLSLSNVQSWWNIHSLSFLPFCFFTDFILVHGNCLFNIHLWAIYFRDQNKSE